MKINFILPGNSNLPIGGNKIVYQYANELSKRGHEVCLTFLFDLHTNSLRFLIKYLFRKQIIKRSGSHKQEVTWFPLDKSIKLKFDVSFLSEVPDADVVIATEARTTNVVAKLSKSKGKKYYFIQNYETWVFDGNIELLNQTYQLGLTNIVISKDLQEKVSQASGKEAYLLPDFYNPEEFYIEQSVEKRKNVVSLLNHSQKSKRTVFGLEILAEVKKVIPDLQVQLFGTTEPVGLLPDYVHFTLHATAQQLRTTIYGSSKVYLLSSELEGWGLTGMEAQASGAALVSGRIGGVIEYATDENSILVNPNKKSEYVNAVVNLLSNDSKRLELVEKSHERLEQFTLKESTSKLEQILGI